MGQNKKERILDLNFNFIQSWIVPNFHLHHLLLEKIELAFPEDWFCAQDFE